MIIHEGNKFLIEISYEGQLTVTHTKDEKGFVLGQYLNERNKTDYYIFTHFEPIFARQCLPCYDEPAIRSIFSVKIEHDSSYEAVSNMPVPSRDKANEIGNEVITSFQETPPMQMYLLAFFIHKFASVRVNSSTTPQKIYVQPNLSGNENLKFIARHLDRVLKAFEIFFDFPYSLPKLDHVIAPHFSTAIENWGLIGYSEFYLEESEMSCIRVFFHEISVSFPF